MSNIKTPGNMSKEEQETAAHVTPAAENDGNKTGEKKRGDAEEQIEIENELEKQDQYPS